MQMKIKLVKSKEELNVKNLTLRFIHLRERLNYMVKVINWNKEFH